MSDGSDKLEQLDYYTLLGIEDDAGPEAIREAFHRFALKYHPDRHTGSADTKIDRATHIYRRGAEAYHILSDPELRHLYDKGLKRGELRLSPPSSAPMLRPQTPGAGTLRVHSPKARPFVTKAEQALRDGDINTARLNLRIAVQHEPANPQLKALLQTLEAQPKKAT